LTRYRSPFLPALLLTWAWVMPLGAFQPAAPDWVAVVGTYPALDTPASRRELAFMHRLQATRTPRDVARAEAGSRPDLGYFLDALGSPLDPEGMPGTVALLRQARRDLKPVVAQLKADFARPRPYTVDATLDPALPTDGSFSFPSKHAALGVLYGSLLSLLDPPDRDALMREGRRIGDDRVMAGLHWPSDDVAGQRLGQAFATWWLALPENTRMLQDAAGEWAQAPGSSRPGARGPG